VSKNLLKDADSHFGAESKIEITLEKPYRKEPPPRLNKFWLPCKAPLQNRRCVCHSKSQP